MGRARGLTLAAVAGSVLVAVVVVVACSASVTPSPAVTVAPSPSAPSGSPSAAPSSPSPAPAASAPVETSAPASATAPSATVTPGPSASAGSWAAAGSMPTDWYDGPVVALPGGRALAIAGDGSAVATWDPSTAAWAKGKGLDTPRWNFAAIALRDGRVLVVGGANDRQQAYSSAWVYDAGTPGGGWSKVGLMSTARSAPAAALLPDGRVLVAGGAFFAGQGSRGAPVADDVPILASTRARPVPVPAAPPPARPPTVVVAVFRPAVPGRAGGSPPFTDIAPSRSVPALATAEIFDPATGSFSPTSAMRFARAGAVATTLSDGRVLLASPGGELWVGQDTGVSQSALASSTTEVYDPTTGRFTLAGPLPSIDRAAIAADGVEVPTTEPWMTSTGTLVALQDGGALLVGHDVSWKHEADVVRTFRFDGPTGRWSQVGPTYAGVNDGQSGAWRSTPGIDLAGSSVAPLSDGRVLAAGGLEPDASQGLRATATAHAFDPATNGWIDLPSMPAGRQGGSAATLSGGSVLVAGGDWSDSGGETAVRFVPGG